MKIIRRTVCGLILLLACSGARTAPLLPEHEWQMIRRIAANYRLSEEETWLLAGIRRLENGRPARSRSATRATWTLSAVGIVRPTPSAGHSGSAASSPR